MKRKKSTKELKTKKRQRTKNGFKSHEDISKSSKFFITKSPDCKTNKADRIYREMRPRKRKKIRLAKPASFAGLSTAKEESIDHARKRMIVYNELLSKAIKSDKLERIKSKDFKIYYSSIITQFEYLQKIKDLSERAVDVAECSEFMINTKIFNENVWYNILSFLNLGDIKTVLLSPLIPDLARGCFRHLKHQIKIKEVRKKDIKVYKSLFSELYMYGSVVLFRISNYGIKKLRNFSSIAMDSISLESICDKALRNIFHSDIIKIKSKDTEDISHLLTLISKIENIEHLNCINSDYALVNTSAKIEDSLDANKYPRMKTFISNCIRLDNYRFHPSLETVEISDPRRLIDIINNTNVSNIALMTSGNDLFREGVFSYMFNQLLCINRNQIDTWRFDYNLNHNFESDIKKILYLLINNIIKSEFICTNINQFPLSIKIKRGNNGKLNGDLNLPQEDEKYILFTLKGRCKECKDLINVLIKMTNNTLIYHSRKHENSKEIYDKFNVQPTVGSSQRFKIKINIRPNGQTKWLKAKRYGRYENDIMIFGKRLKIAEK